MNLQGDQQGGNLSLSANGTTAGSGIVWATHSVSGGGGGGAAVAGVLYAFNAENVTTELWDSNTTGERAGELRQVHHADRGERQGLRADVLG